MSFGSHSRLARAVTISKAVLVADETLLRSRKSESLKTTIERGHERGVWAGMVQRIG